MKKNKTYETGRVYVGTDISKKKNMDSKVGYTSYSLKERENKIRRDNKHPRPNYRMIGCLVLHDITEAQLKHIESEVHVRMEKYAVRHGNDYFTYRANTTAEIATKTFAVIALGYAIDCCNREGYSFTIEWVR